MSDISAITDLVFKDADAAHKAHLYSQSYAEHMALGEFYEGARDAIDELTEAMIGLGDPVPPSPMANPAKALEECYVELMRMRNKTCNGDPTLENLYDGLTSVYVKAIYKLSRLK